MDSQLIPFSSQNPDRNFWSGKRVLVTGHTGFKGSLLTFWLRSLGATVLGYSLPPQSHQRLYSALHQDLPTSTFSDILDYNNLYNFLKNEQPYIIFHLAAQPLVLTSYCSPLETFQVNVIGTANLLDAIKSIPNYSPVVVNITTDKVYLDTSIACKESDPLGGLDPYSASKACSEIASYSYYHSFLEDKSVSLATVRAGNVIGGGDWSPNRLIPDVVRHLYENQSLQIRNPHSIRPWQHVFEPLNFYMLLAESLSHTPASFSSWNIGPLASDCLTVAQLISHIDPRFSSTPKPESITPLRESPTLLLDISKAISLLGWEPRLSINQTIQFTTNWYNSYYAGCDIPTTTLEQINHFTSLIQ